MKTLLRSTKCSFKFANPVKIALLRAVLQEYSRVVNVFIAAFWVACPSKFQLRKSAFDIVKDSWLTAVLKQGAAAEAISMVHVAKGIKGEMPIHRGTRMRVNANIAEFKKAKIAGEFDYWLHLNSMGHGIVIDIPVRVHKHFNKLLQRGQLCRSYVITANYVQLAFRIPFEARRTAGPVIAIDSGLNTLASLSTGQQLGNDIRGCTERVARCKYMSKGRLKAKRALRQRINEVVKQVSSLKPRAIVVERLKGIKY